MHVGEACDHQVAGIAMSCDVLSRRARRGAVLWDDGAGFDRKFSAMGEHRFGSSRGADH